MLLAPSRPRDLLTHLLMPDSRFKGAAYIVNLKDQNILAAVDSFDDYSDAINCFNRTVALGSFGRWKEVYLEGIDRAGEFIDLYQVHIFRLEY